MNLQREKFKEILLLLSILGSRGASVVFEEVPESKTTLYKMAARLTTPDLGKAAMDLIKEYEETYFNGEK